MQKAARFSCCPCRRMLFTKMPLFCLVLVNVDDDELAGQVGIENWTEEELEWDMNEG